MRERNGYPAGVPCWIDTAQPDPDAAAAFYGTWNFSELNTRDPEGAAAFYGSVLGWGLSTFNGGGAEFTTWRVPGYGEHLAATDPELRERLANDGAPHGFEDAVAVLIAAAEDEAEPGRPDLGRLAFDAGYADQAHLSRDCARLSGLAPGALLRARAAA